MGVAFHRTAFALVTRPLVLPQGAANAHVESYKGFALRVVMGYDQAKKQDVVSIDTLYGVKTLDPNRAVLIHGVVCRHSQLFAWMQRRSKPDRRGRIPDHSQGVFEIRLG
ncbi:P22 phage major capsid protein family protein [Nonomuraea basaltis]|uniref:P22 phage major capsid protein family protein n=1 Tax=Nonomuraea basaltis TaxID=2495887 RepID=UPI0023F38375|nr:P22 phage major capsid protein family protein [Nonomuraea basaltis]